MCGHGCFFKQGKDDSAKQELNVHSPICTYFFTTYSYFAIFVSVCLSVCPSMQGLGRPGNELMAAAPTIRCFMLAGCSPPRCKRNQAMPVLSTVEAQLLFHKSICESSPISTGMARNRRLTTNKPRSLHRCYSTLCPISELSDPVDSQNQLEFISPPVGKPSTCIVTP